jgi:hypothetical protein
VSTFEELLGRKSSGSGLDTENTTVRICHADHVAPSTRKLALTSMTSGGLSVGIVRSRTHAKDFVFNFQLEIKLLDNNTASKLLA